MRITVRYATAIAAVALTTAMFPAGAGAQARFAAPSVPRLISPGTRRGVKPIHHLAATPTAATATGRLKLRTSGTEGVIAVTPQVYLVFWGSQWSSDPANAAPALQSLFNGLYGSADPWGQILDQYCEGLPAGTVNCGTSGTHVQHPSATPLAGVWFDNATAAPTKASVNQIAGEAAAAATHFGNTTQGSNLNAQYVIASAHGTHPNGFPTSNFCAWHSSASTGVGTIAYTNLPYIPDIAADSCTTMSPAQPLDGYMSSESHEYAESVTDLWPTNGWLDASGAEVGDKCINLDAYETLSTGTFDVQGLFSNSADRCVSTTSTAWTVKAKQPQAASNLPPALTYFNGDLYAAWVGTTGNTVSYAALNGTTWSSPATISGSWGSALTSVSPALAVFNGQLYAAWTDNTSGDIWYSTTSDGSTWSPPATISGSWGTAASDHGPALAANANGPLLAVAYKGQADDNVYYSALSGGTWSDPVAVPGAATTVAPAIAGTPSSTSSVFAVAWTTSTEKIDTEAATSTNGWSAIETLPNALTQQTPAIALMDGAHLVVGWKAAGTSTKVRYDYALDYSGASDSFAPMQTVPKAGTDLSPAIASDGTTLTTAWLGVSPSTSISYSMTTNFYE